MIFLNSKTTIFEMATIEEKIFKGNGEVSVKKYVRGKKLGKGGFAVCFEVTNLETKKKQAAKIIAKKSLSKSRSK